MRRSWTAPLLAIASGFASALGFAPTDWWPVTLVAIAVLLWLVHDAPSFKRALLIGWLFGVAHFTLGNSWIQHAFDYQQEMPPELGYGAVVLLALYLAVYPAAAAGLAWRWGRVTGGPPDERYVLVFAAGWIVTEWLRASMFTGYSWNPLGMVWLAPGVAQIASFIGTYALSGLVVLASGAGLLLAAGLRWRLGAIVAVPVVASLFLHPGAQPDYAADHPRVRVVQPNIGQEFVGTDGYKEAVFQKLLSLSGGPAPHPRILAWPEGTVNFYVEDDYPLEWYEGVSPAVTRARIAARLGERDIALVGGNALIFGTDGELAGAGNSVFAILPSGELAGRYDKAHLVPYGEYLPMRSILQPLGLSRLVMGDIDFLPSPGPANLSIPGIGLAGMQICYEIIFSGQVVADAARPQFLFNPSNDAWFGHSGPPQHLAQARMRAIEEGLPILRSTPTGISAVIGAKGELIATIPSGVEGAIEVPLPAPREPTFFGRVGNWMVVLSALLLIAIAFAFRRTRR